MASTKNFMDSIVETTKKLTINSLESNQPINRIGGKNGDMNSKFWGGTHGVIKNMRKNGDQAGMGFMDAVKTAHTTKEGKANWAAIAGSTMTAGAAMRVASGGGAYRDANGNTDIAGVPFI